MRLADATKTDKQMLFLDEPFAFFDPERTNNTLHSLAETSKGAVSQIWLTAQTKPEGVKLAHVIHCAQGSHYPEGIDALFFEIYQTIIFSALQLEEKL